MPPKDLKMSKQKEVVMINVEWLESKSACKEGCLWFEDKYKADSIAGDLLVEVLIKDKKLDWANWLITKIMTEKQRLTYAVYAAEQIAYLWKDKYPDKYKIWKKWVDDGCPESMRDAARDAARAARDAAGAAGAAAWDAARAAGAAARAAGAAAWAAWDAMLTKILEHGLKLLKDN